MKRRVAQYLLNTECPLCHGKRLRLESLSVKFAGFDIADISRLPLKRLAGIIRPFADGTAPDLVKAGGRTSGKGDGHRADYQGPAGPDRRAARPGAGLSGAGAQHAHAFARRAAASAAGHAGAVESVRRRLCARRAIGRAASGRYRGAAAGPRSTEGLGQFAVRGGARTRRDPACRLDCRRRTGGRRAGGAGALQRPAGGAQTGRAVADAPFSVRRAGPSRPGAALAPGLAATGGRHAQQSRSARRRFSAGRALPP